MLATNNRSFSVILTHMTKIGRRILMGIALLILATPVLVAQSYNSIWDGSSLLFPDQVCPQWNFADFGSGTVPVFVGDSLQVAAGETQTLEYYMYITPPQSGDTASFEFKLRYVSGAFANNRTPCSVFWATDSVGGYFYIGQDVIFDWSDFNVIGGTLNIDTDDSVHTYLIKISSDNNYEIYRDSVFVMGGFSFFNSGFIGLNQVGWGKLAGGVSGESKWLSFSHNASGILGSPTSSSTFDTGMEYWGLDGNSQFDWQPSGGNPGGYLHLIDTDPDGAYIHSPGKFLGDWSSLNGKGVIAWDHKLFQLGGDPVAVPFIVKIEGPGGKAQFVLDRDPEFQWTTICAPLQESSWNVTEGTWSNILECISSVRITIEMIENSSSPGDEDGIDNIRLYVCVSGDADNNGIITISDAVYLINYIFSGGAAPCPLLAGDADCNTIITISDAVYLINYIFAGGPAPC